MWQERKSIKEQQVEKFSTYSNPKPFVDIGRKQEVLFDGIQNIYETENEHTLLASGKSFNERLQSGAEEVVDDITSFIDIIENNKRKKIIFAVGVFAIGILSGFLFPILAPVGGVMTLGAAIGIGGKIMLFGATVFSVAFIGVPFIRGIFKG